ncbi:LamG-like jellyroll fold domain-containing protein [Paenibacillus sp. FSL M7-1046]|uniref:LamG-like jellyroll fold domain-containing protein n=1 Tax=Paenibacillus sp. FSL M7-1046 TaxID=2975315 RepID=UPI0030F4F727
MTGKLTSSFLALLLLVPSPIMAASGAVNDNNKVGQLTAKISAPDYTGHWAQDDFQTWVDNGLLTGYGNGVYKPEQNITRAEWVSLVGRVFNLQTLSESRFSDVADGSVYYNDVMKAVSAGFVSGYSDGTFRPAQTVSRQEAAVMLYRLFQLDASTAAAAPKDAAELPEWSREAVLTLLGDGFLSGYEDGSVKGKRAVTRAEALRLISKLSGQIILKSGTYSDLTARNVIVSTAGVELKNASIAGNLYLTEGIAEGDVTLDNVKVAGKIVVTGGGENSVVMHNSTASRLVVNKKNGKLRVITKGSSAVTDVIVQSGVKLEEDAAATGTGFSKITVEQTLSKNSVVQLSGSFDSVVMNALGEPALVLNRGSITDMTLNRKTGLRVEAGTEIKNLKVGVKEQITVQGSGKVVFDPVYSSLIKLETPAATATATATAGSGGGTPIPPTATPSPMPSATPSATPTPSPTATPVVSPEATAPVFSNVSVHDPSVVKDGDTYYVFGSHIEAAESQDLMNWSTFTNGYKTPDNVLYGDLSANLAESFAWAGENDSDSKGGFSVWAPDVFWNEDYVNEDGTKGTYMMYYSTSSTYIRSAIGYAVSQNIKGPYTYGGTVLYSGFTAGEAYDANSDVNKKWTNTNIQTLIDDGTLEAMNPAWFNTDGTYNNKMYTNAIDPTLFYDKDGKLWMTYGSWSGGIFVLEVDPATGGPKYPGEDGTTADGRIIDRYFGTKISGGNYKSGEGPYVMYDKNTDYYYLYVTYGGLAADGGYSMRQFRSSSPSGPYKDAAGQDAVLTTDGDHSAYGNKLLGNFLFTNVNGDPDFPVYGYVSSGHNSVYYDEDSGKTFNFFHTRFPYRGEAHELRVHQMFMNEDGWPVVAPHRYSGETIGKVAAEDIAGAYQFINHGKDISAKIKSSADIELLADGTITGPVTGTWKLKGDYYADLLINETQNGTAVERLYKGVFVKLWDSTRQDHVMTFTAMSDQGIAVWGSALETLSDEQLVANATSGLTLGNTSKVYRDLTLPSEGVRGIAITWSSSNEAVVGNDGKVTRPEVGSGDTSVELTATIRLGNASATKTFTVGVVALSGSQLEDGLVGAYDFEGNLEESGGRLEAGTETGNRVNNTGGTVTYVSGEDGQAAQLDGSSGIRLPNGLISGSSYTVGMWLNPDELTAFTTAFFGAKSDTNWISLLPYGNGVTTTRLWFGSEAWMDADTGLQIKAGEWSHVAFTYDAGTVKMYVNGVLKSTKSGFTNVFTDDSGVFALGVNYWDIPYKGLVDKFRVYEKALSPEAVGWLVNGESETDTKVTSISFGTAVQQVAAGNSYTPVVSILPANAGNQQLEWSSSTPEVAVVDAVTGVVTALKVGDASITAKATDGSAVTSSYQVKVTDGKIAYYAFDGSLQDSLQLSAAGKVTGDKVDSATVGSITYGTGVAGQAAVFDGTSGIRLPDGLLNSSTYSVSMWLNPAQLTDFTTTFFGASTMDSWISLVLQNAGGQTLLWSGTAWYDALTGLLIPLNEWTHVAFTVREGEVKVYINGSEKFSGTGFPDVFTNKNAVFTLGINYWNPPFKGLIDELKVYNNTLSAEDVLAEYNLNSN